MANSITLQKGLRDRVADRCLGVTKKDLSEVMHVLEDEIEAAFKRGLRVRFTTMFSLVPVVRKERKSFDVNKREMTTRKKKCTVVLILNKKFSDRISTTGKPAGLVHTAPKTAHTTTSIRLKQLSNKSIAKEEKVQECKVKVKRKSKLDSKK